MVCGDCDSLRKPNFPDRDQRQQPFVSVRFLCIFAAISILADSTTPKLSAQRVCATDFLRKFAPSII